MIQMRLALIMARLGDNRPIHDIDVRGLQYGPAQSIDNKPLAHIEGEEKEVRMKTGPIKIR